MEGADTIQKKEPCGLIKKQEQESRVAVPLLTKHGRAAQGLKCESLLITILPIPFVYHFKPSELAFLHLRPSEDDLFLGPKELSVTRVHAAFAVHQAH